VPPIITSAMNMPAPICHRDIPPVSEIDIGELLQFRRRTPPRLFLEIDIREQPVRFGRGRRNRRLVVQLSKVEETGFLAQRLCSMQTVHYATVGFFIACMIWAAVMVLYKAR
jgi:hypothetical protein